MLTRLPSVSRNVAYHLTPRNLHRVAEHLTAGLRHFPHVIRQEIAEATGAGPQNPQGNESLVQAIGDYLGGPRTP
ncbi:MAG: hypothetical protein MUC88_08875 [Planctomycetes bacterium]|nr:hypothetical protein [Planctomycetota bacterium]